MNIMIHATVVSKDGTRIGYGQVGQGPGLLLLQGTMGTAYHFSELAAALADRFTVYVPDRRGRGRSDVGVTKYSMQREVEDVAALLGVTNAGFVFGLSSGAIIALQAALDLPGLRKVAIYEPPLFVDGAPKALLQRFDREWAQGNIPAAMVTAMIAAEMGPPIFKYLPRFMLEGFVRRIMAAEASQVPGPYPTMQTLAETLPNDLSVVRQTDGGLARYSLITLDVLLLGGSKSPTYLKRALRALADTLPNSRTVELAGVGHAAAWNRDRQRNPDGDPRLVAQALHDFFAVT